LNSSGTQQVYNALHVARPLVNFLVNEAQCTILVLGIESAIVDK